jgi:hypothetical protein
MGRSRIPLLFVLLLLTMGLVAGYGAIDTQPTCPSEHQDLRHGDVEREFLVQYPVFGEDVPIVDHAWVAIHDNSSVAIGSVFATRTAFVHPSNGTVDHQSQSFDGEWQTPDGNVSLWVDFNLDEAKISIENAVFERSIEGPVVEYCGPLGD